MIASNADLGTSLADGLIDLEKGLLPSSTRITASGDVRCRPVPHPRAYENALGSIVLKLAPTSEADPIGILGSLMAATGAAVGPGVRLSIADSNHPLLLWFILCGRTAQGRKGTAERVANRVFQAAMPEFFSKNVQSGLSSGEGLVAAVADSDDPEAPPRDTRLLIVESEFAAVLNRAKRDGNTLAAVLRQAWDGSDLRVLTRSPLTATSPHIAVVGHIPPLEFKSLVSARDLAGGSYNRLLMLYVERSRRLPDGEGADPALVAKLAEELRARTMRASAMGLVRRAPSARAVWAELYDEFVELEEDEQLAPWVSRAVPYTLRLAALHAAMDGTADIGVGHLQSAAALMRYSLDSVRYVLEASSPHSDTEAIAKAIREAGPEGLSRSVITKRFSSRYPAAVLRDLLIDVTALDGYSEETMPSDGGRPPTVYRYLAPTAALSDSTT